MRAALLALFASLLCLPAQAVTVTGRVVGPDGQPVVGADVVLDPDFSQERLVEIKTDKSGVFSATVDERDTSGGKRFGRVCICAPGFGVAGGVLRQAENTIRLHPAAVITGKVVDQQGKPVAGAVVKLRRVRLNGGVGYVLVLGRIEEEVTARSGPDGIWRLGSVPAAEGTASVSLDDDRYVHAEAQVEISERGGTAPDLVARPGATIAGRVVYEKGRPAARVRVFAQPDERAAGRFPRDGAWSDSRSATDGSYRLGGLSTGSSNVMVDDLSGRWVAAALEGVKVKEGTTTRVDDLVLTSGAIIEGTVVDDATGKPLAGARIGCYGPHRPRSSAAIIGAMSDENGRFRLRVAPGESHLYVQSAPEGYQPPRTDWRDVTLDKGDTRAVEFRLPKAPEVVTIPLRGRVVATDGQPVEGAVVTVQIIPPQRGTQGGRVTAGVMGRPQYTTDSSGRYALERVEAGSDISVSVEKTGYRWVSGGDVRKLADSFYVTDLVLARGSAKVQGRVVDESGDPVANATVMSPDGDPDVEVKPDSSGRFALDSLPEGKALLVAATKETFGEVVVEPGDEEVVIALGPPPPLKSADIERGYAIVKELAEASAGTDYYGRESLPGEIAHLDPQLALELARAPDGSVGDRAIEGILFTLSESDPVVAAKWADAWLSEIKDQAGRAMSAATVGVVVADTDRDAAISLYQLARDSAAAAPPSGQVNEEAHVVRVFADWGIAALAAKLGRPEAAELVERAMKESVEDAKEGKGEGYGLAQAGIEFFALGSADWAEKLANELAGRDRVHALARIIDQIATRNPAAADAMLSRIEPPTDETERYYYAVAAKRMIEVLGPSSPARALAIARKAGEQEPNALALALAAQFQEPPVARELFSEAAEVVASEPGTVARIAAMALDKDHELGLALFEKAQAALDGDHHLGDFAFYYSRVAPGGCRLMLEKRFSTAIASGPGGSRSSNVASLALAMAPIDVDRALAMARSIPSGGHDGHFDAQRKLAQYVLATDEVRRTMPFDRWNASDTWRPGTPSGW